MIEPKVGKFKVGDVIKNMRLAHAGHFGSLYVNTAQVTYAVLDTDTLFPAGDLWIVESICDRGLYHLIHMSGQKVKTGPTEIYDNFIPDWQ